MAATPSSPLAAAFRTVLDYGDSDELLDPATAATPEGLKVALLELMQLLRPIHTRDARGARQCAVEIFRCASTLQQSRSEATYEAKMAELQSFAWDMGVLPAE